MKFQTSGRPPSFLKPKGEFFIVMGLCACVLFILVMVSLFLSHQQKQTHQSASVSFLDLLLKEDYQQLHAALSPAFQKKYPLGDFEGYLVKQLGFFQPLSYQLLSQKPFKTEGRILAHF